jgi:hypothetical protein
MINCIEQTELERKIKIVQGQTDYTEEQAREKLTLNNFDEMKCIREYLGVPSKTSIKPKQVSLNQQIYKEIRHKMGSVELPSPNKIP